MDLSSPALQELSLPAACLQPVSKRTVSISVRDLVAFVLRRGDLGSNRQFAGPNRALEGTRGHQRAQKSRPPGYEAEVPVSRSVETPEFTLELKGRIDGVLVREGELLIEEIKTVSRLAGIEADPLHWAQARLYAFLYCESNGFGAASVRLTYVQLETFEALEFTEMFTFENLTGFFEQVIHEYIEWLQEHDRWLKQRDASILALAFPFAYRPGQRAMAVAVYRNIRQRGRLFVEAPTGIGKTLSVLFPSIKALAAGEIEKIFYLTARTVGRAVAEETLAELRARGLKFRSVTITARDKMCFNNGQPCDLSACPFAIGYYDRVKAALRESLRRDVFTRSEIEDLARRHSVCPFELALDLTLWADGVVCDYNYAIDPFVALKRYFSGERREFAMLVDEAHNLVDRGRDMFSADLFKEEVLALRSALPDELKKCARLLGKINSRLLEIGRDENWIERGGHRLRKEVPEKIIKLLRDFCAEAEQWLVLNQPSNFRQPLLDFYFHALALIRISEFYDERYVTIFEGENGRLRLFCVDPSALLREALSGLGSTVFFSATLGPADYYRESLGGDPSDSCLVLDSPFAPDSLKVLVHRSVPTRLRDRGRSYEEIADSIAAMASARRGNYLVYFPSYEYLREVMSRFTGRYPEFRTEGQHSGMSEPAREQFLNRFQPGPQTLVGFAVLGGIFGEGIDLVGDRLIGVAVVGVGLPQLCVERDLIREFWQARAKPGFDFAYTFPGMNRVLQAAGRTIRSENDRGVVLLLDERFARQPYPAVFPAWGNLEFVRAPAEIARALEDFWSGLDRAQLTGPLSHRGDSLSAPGGTI